MAGLDTTSFAAALKELYTDQRLEKMLYTDHPFFAMVPKRENFQGSVKPLPLSYAPTTGRSATFSTAKANKGPSSQIRFLLTRNKDYSLATIDNETILASESDKGAFMEAVTHEIDMAIHSITRSLATALYRSGSGSIGRLDNASFATTTLELVDVDEVVNFEVGMYLKFSATDGGGSLKANRLQIVAIDRDAGTMTVDANLSTITGIAQNDFIFVEGDYDNKVKGIDAWIPTVAPTSGDSHFGVDRSADATRLAGIRVTATGQPIEEALIDAMARVAREGARPTHIFMNYRKFRELSKALGSKVQYVDPTVNGKPVVGFKGMVIQGPKGDVTVYADQNCQGDRAYILDMSTWTLESLKRAPHILDMDGLKFLRENDEDGIEVRVGYYAQLGCTAPGKNCVVLL